MTAMTVMHIETSDAASGHANVTAPRSMATRLMHGALLVGTVHQLIGSQFLGRLVPGQTPPLLALHEYVGLATAAPLVLFWAWSLVRQRETPFGRLVPWFSAARRSDVWRDVKAQFGRVLRLRLPDDADGAAASAIHGLGLLVLTVMVATGAGWYFIDPVLAKPVLILHKMTANLMWAYLVAHAGFALIHHIAGSDIFRRMFWTRSAKSA